MIRNARLHVTVNEVSIEAIAFVRDPLAISKEQGYRSVTNLTADRSAAAEAVATELRSAAALLRRARDVAASLGFEADTIQQHAESVESLAAALAPATSAAEDAA